MRVEHTHIEAEPDGRETRQVFEQVYAWVTKEELRELLRAAGFRDVRVLGGYAGRPFDDGAERMVFVARPAS